MRLGVRHGLLHGDESVNSHSDVDHRGWRPVGIPIFKTMDDFPVLRDKKSRFVKMVENEREAADVRRIGEAVVMRSSWTMSSVDVHGMVSGKTDGPSFRVETYELAHDAGKPRADLAYFVPRMIRFPVWKRLRIFVELDKRLVGGAFIFADSFGLFGRVHRRVALCALDGAGF